MVWTTDLKEATQVSRDKLWSSFLRQQYQTFFHNSHNLERTFS